MTTPRGTLRSTRVWRTLVSTSLLPKPTARTRGHTAEAARGTRAEPRMWNVSVPAWSTATAGRARSPVDIAASEYDADPLSAELVHIVKRTGEGCGASAFG